MYPDHDRTLEDLDSESTQQPQVEQQSNKKKIRCSYCKQFGHREMVFGRIRCPIKRNDSNLSSSLERPPGGADISKFNDSKMIESSNHNNDALNDDQTEELLAILEMNEQDLQINDDDDDD
ncbi:hypothetical protein BLA29_012568 [Euroglyphus maynei]|uniref:Uncharacterized protein n=1 Tax=Euroglyphus maynei TaxID=6958 RepID=A0A1Y3BVT7_EURMA|nr:hypothetical protein BLA29_012568 [Euroglyphus maynei]